MVFTDASSNMDEHNLKVFIICTHSVVGALPLGIIITSDEQTETLATAFAMYKSCLPEDAFYGKGAEGPSIFMTDNCSELWDALKAVWPSAVSLASCTAIAVAPSLIARAKSARRSSAVRPVELRLQMEGSPP